MIHVHMFSLWCQKENRTWTHGGKIRMMNKASLCVFYMVQLIMFKPIKSKGSMQITIELTYRGDEVPGNKSLLKVF